jgi:hypothetical protein
MKAKTFIFYLLAILLGGCFPVMSLHPLFNEKDVVFDGKLLGAWVEEPNATWEFSRTEGPKNAYKLIYTRQEKEEVGFGGYIAQARKAKGSFIVRLVKLKDNLFLDICPASREQQDPNKVNFWVYNVFLIPAHTFVKINSVEPQLKMQVTDDEKMKEFLIEQDPNAVKHEFLEDGSPILTGSTKELQAFVLKYADDSRVFTEAMVLSRKKTADPNAPPPSKRN